ncbi:MAG: hypothetical protein KDI90_01790 [Alphaproteobacteria bacterium]|nr:hypothetical protein [Alphaproteobacteria bacterium]MCB9975218.1 hypothetical protein [Rhodospirillales bacterium]
MPTIRIDEDVYKWLQSQARAFEDSPNSVLRRIAKLNAKSLDKEEVKKENSRLTSNSKPIKKRSLSGKKLNKEWGVGAIHSLYRKTGDWYNNLEKFPGALFDSAGYVVFETEKDFVNSPYLQIGQTTHVPGGISKIPGYVQKK